MRTLYDFLGDLLRRPPSATEERLMPWLMAALGTMILALVAYAWIAARVTV